MTHVQYTDNRPSSVTNGKIITRSNKYHAHDETDQIKMGDLVEIQECRPISKTKAWKVMRVVQAAVLA